MEIDTQLKQFGLNKSEIVVYLDLLEHGLSTPPQIAKRTRIARTNTYNILQSLKDKRLIDEQARGKRKAYLAADPQALIAAEERKKQALERLLPALRGLYASQKHKPKVRYYDGFEEAKAIWNELLSAQKIYGIGSTSKLFALSPGFFEQFRQQVKRRGIEFYDIITHESARQALQTAQISLGDLYQTKVLPKDYEDIPTDILIWNDNVALITTEEPIFGTVLTSQDLARTFEIVFKTMWQAL